ncbi:hypothetical protein C0Q70_14169 [Pomacea canaliculata]|uniref:Uncharacterized protein n=1 Tax=Pomacea canaliculata TaxID=400727 RepID=A0A2T7NZ87_POMCA|nr:hypothetical protein C0Q70_14169 [Pomacea canaliculata]
MIIVLQLVFVASHAPEREEDHTTPIDEGEDDRDGEAVAANRHWSRLKCILSPHFTSPHLIFTAEGVNRGDNRRDLRVSRRHAPCPGNSSTKKPRHSTTPDTTPASPPNLLSYTSLLPDLPLSLSTPVSESRTRYSNIQTYTLTELVNTLFLLPASQVVKCAWFRNGQLAEKCYPHIMHRPQL